MKVRPYQTTDYPQVKDILVKSKLFDEIWDSEENLKGLADNTSPSLLVAELDGVLVGQLYIIRFGSKVAQIYRLAVKEQYQKQGIATQLLEEVQTQLRLQGVEEIGLFVDAKKTGLIEFYIKRGFSGSTTPCIYLWKKL